MVLEKLLFFKKIGIEVQCKRMFKLTFALICTSKEMLKILQARLQQYLNQEIPEVQAGFREGKGTRDQISNIHWIIEKAREFQKKHFCFTDYVKAFHCVQFSSVTQSCPSLCSITQSCLTLCDPLDCSMPGLPVHHQLPELVQTHVHQVGDAIQPSHPLSSPSLGFSLSQHQGLFQ